MKRSFSTSAVIGILIAGCLLAKGCVNSGEAPDEAPGYYGPLPSEASVQALGKSIGKRYTDKTGRFGGGVWEVFKGMAVIPNPSSPRGKGPVACLEQGERVAYYPVETDADVQAFLKDVTP